MTRALSPARLALETQQGLLRSRRRAEKSVDKFTKMMAASRDEFKRELQRQPPDLVILEVLWDL